MKISENRKQELYNAIQGSIMELRIEIKMAVSSGKSISAEGLDELLYGLTETIWYQQKQILNISL